RRDTVAQHRARIGIDDGKRKLALEVLRGGDAVAPFVDEEIGPFLQSVVVENVHVAREELLDRELKLDVHRGHRPMCLRYCCHNPRTDVSVTRDSLDSTLFPPISTTEAFDAAPC